MVLKWFKSVVLSPQLWFGAAAVSVAGSFVIDYVEAQNTADRALALRQGTPPVAALQAFDPAVNVGPAREVLIHAETDLETAVVVTLGTEADPQRAVIYPLFAVSEPGAEAIARKLESDGTLATMRPMPRPTEPVEVPQALGVILHMAEGPNDGDLEAGALIQRYFGNGTYGAVVEINGERVSPGDMALVVKGAMAARNMSIAEGFLAVAPYEDGRLAALTPPATSGLQRALLWGGSTLAAMAAMLLSVRTVEVAEQSRAAPKQPGRQDTRVSTGTTVKARTRFQTIPTQDELYASAQARQAREAEPSQTRRLFDGAKSGVDKIRSRR